MADYIRKDLLLELAREYYTPALREEAVPVRAIRNIPSADVVEVVRAKWMWHSSTYDKCPPDVRYHCTHCNHEVITHGKNPIENFCPNCGARMVEHE
jgi:DNA-directed RNA polymerase subunit RPC12/RpoP